jgi:hypothetical protein
MPRDSPFLRRTQFPSQGSSCGQARPVIAGNALSSRIFAAAPAKSPAAINFTNARTFTPTGQCVKQVAFHTQGTAAPPGAPAQRNIPSSLRGNSSSLLLKVAFFTRGQATQIIEAAPEPFKTLFAVAWTTGLREGRNPGADAR